MLLPSFMIFGTVGYACHTHMETKAIFWQIGTIASANG
jgi:hypothetical protein